MNDVPMESREVFFTCPYCWQRVSMLVDLSVAAQSYIEDCETCCRPIELRYVVRDGEVTELRAESIEQ